MKLQQHLLGRQSHQHSRAGLEVMDRNDSYLALAIPTLISRELSLIFVVEFVGLIVFKLSEYLLQITSK